MTVRPVMVDTTRLLTRLKHAAPTGIDRVDLAYARHFLRGSYQGLAAAATPFGIRILPEAQLDRLFASLDARWSRPEPAGGDAVLAAIARRLATDTPTAEPSPPAVVPRRREAGRGLGVPLDQIGLRLAHAAHAMSWREAARAPEGTVYIHASHIRLDRPHLFAWLDRRPDIRVLFFIHDIIPIEYPEYGIPGEAARHRVRMATVSRRAAGIMVSTRDVESRLAAYFAAEGLRVPPIAVAPIGVEPIFERAGGPGPPPALVSPRPYFVVCSTIEARKNHLLLLQIWRDLAPRLGAAMPALVIVGRRGWESENVVDLLDRCPAIQPHVIEASGLSTPGLVALLRGARALLMPSFAEGYGIPVVEALSLGTAVIASDLPAHREISGGRATLLHPLDGLGWRDAILRMADPTAPTVDGPFRPPLWRDHFRTLDDVVAAL